MSLPTVPAEATAPSEAGPVHGRPGVSSWALSALVHGALAGVALLAVLLANQPPPPPPITVRLELTEPATATVEQPPTAAEAPPVSSPSPPPDAAVGDAPADILPPDEPPALRAEEPAPSPQPATARPPQTRPVARRAAPTAPPEAPATAAAAEAVPTAPPPMAAPPREVPVAAAPAPVAPRAVPPSYAGVIRARLERFKHYPSEARRSREEGTVQLLFTIDRTGRLLDWRLERSSGFELLDAAARNMVERAAPFPPPPDDLLGQRFEFALPVPFELR